MKDNILRREITIKIIIITFLSLIGVFSSNLYAKDFQFFCNADHWLTSPSKNYYSIFVKSSDCITVKRHLFLTAYLKAKSQCHKWADALGIGHKDVTFFFNDKSCQEENQKIDHDFDQRKINRIYSYSQQSGIFKTNYYISNTGLEKAIYLKDGSEQAQWIEVEDRRFCGLFDSDVAFLETPQSLIVRVLSTGKEFTYLRISKDAEEEIFRATSRKYDNYQFLSRIKGLSFFNFNRDGSRTTGSALNLSYVDSRRGQRYCRPLLW